MTDEETLARSQILIVENKGLNKRIDDYNVSMEEAALYISLHFKDRVVSAIEPYIVGTDTLLFFCSFDKGSVVIAGDKRVPPIVAIDDKDIISMEEDRIGPELWLYSYAEDILAMKNSGLIDNNENVELWNRLLHSNARIGKYNSPQTKSDYEKWCVWYDGTYVGPATTTFLVPHLVETKWGQEYPWNVKSPLGVDASSNIVRCPTGCSAVAMAQVIY